MVCCLVQKGVNEKSTAHDVSPSNGVATVFGANGGIGQGLINQLTAEGQFSQVLGFSRSGGSAFDITDEASIEQVVSEMRPYADRLRLVIDATGVLDGSGCFAEKTWRQLDAAAMAKTFAVNAIGPALLMKHVLPLLPTASRCVFATLSARVGSIGDNHLGGWYSYRASKAALNQLVRTAAIELRRTRPQAICVAVHPGTVATRLSERYTKAGLAVQSPATAAKRMLDMLENLKPEASGGFFDVFGRPITW